MTHLDSYTDEFNSLIEELKDVLDISMVNRIGLFEWISEKKSNGRIKKKYRITTSTLIGAKDAKSSLGWYLNYSDARLELISIFRIGIGGDVILYKFIREKESLEMLSTEILKIS
jgi:hypothetical protein